MLKKVRGNIYFRCDARSDPQFHNELANFVPNLQETLAQVEQMLDLAPPNISANLCRIGQGDGSVLEYESFTSHNPRLRKSAFFKFTPKPKLRRVIDYRKRINPPKLHKVFLYFKKDSPEYRFHQASPDG